MASRRNFMKIASLTTLGVVTACRRQSPEEEKSQNVNKEKILPVVISTWQHGIVANEAAWKILASDGKAIDAVEHGVRVPESAPDVTSVGYGGLPDRDGKVILDAPVLWMKKEMPVQ